MTSTSESYSSRTNRPKLVPGTELQNRYRVVRQLGKGGMGAVYEAVDLRLDATVAIKEAFSTDARLRKQFEHEARLLAQLHHPALPRVTDYFTEDERVFLVMQFIAGDDLAEIISTQPGPLPRNTVIAWADQLLDALIYLHTRAPNSSSRYQTAQFETHCGRKDRLARLWFGEDRFRLVGLEFFKQCLWVHAPLLAA